MQHDLDSGRRLGPAVVRAEVGGHDLEAAVPVGDLVGVGRLVGAHRRAHHRADPWLGGQVAHGGAHAMPPLQQLGDAPRPTNPVPPVTSTVSFMPAPWFVSRSANE